MRTFQIMMSFCVGLFIGYMVFSGIGETEQPLVQLDQSTPKKAREIDSVQQAAERLMAQKTALLSSQIKVLNANLKESRFSLEQQRAKVRALTGRLITDSLKVNPGFPVDSLQSGITELESVTDTLIEQQDRKQIVTEKLLAVRDTELVVCRHSFRQLDSLVNDQIRREIRLTEDLNVALKQQKRKRVQNRFMAGGMLLIAGFTTSLLVKSRQ